MKYPLEIIDTENTKRVMLPCLSRTPHCFGELIIAIDTGSPRTFLMIWDADRLNIPFNSLEATDPLRGMGGGSLPAKLKKKFIIRPKSEDNKMRDIEDDMVVANLPAIQGMGSSTLNRTLQIPSIIGLDFLKKHGFRLVLDMKQKKGYLEDDGDIFFSSSNK